MVGPAPPALYVASKARITVLHKHILHVTIFETLPSQARVYEVSKPRNTFLDKHCLTNIFNFVVMYIRCSSSCPLLLTIIGTLPLCDKSYKYHEKLVFVLSALHLPLVNLTSEMSYKAYAS